LSRVHQRHRQTDRQTTDNRQTTDGRLIAYSDREREFTFAKNSVNLRRIRSSGARGWFRGFDGLVCQRLRNVIQLVFD